MKNTDTRKDEPKEPVEGQNDGTVQNPADTAQGEQR